MTHLEDPLAVGRTAEIYPWEDGKVLKLFLPFMPLPWIEGEARAGLFAQDTHLPVPRVYGRIQVDGREGIIYERVEGRSMLSELGRTPWKVVRIARLLARLHAQVHAVAAPAELEPQREWARGGILETEWLPEELRQSVLWLLDSLPDGSQLCHGDFHPGNILMARGGPKLIDWMSATRGMAAGDVARTSIILELGQPLKGTPARVLLEALRRLFRSTYLSTYFQLRPAERDLLAAWRAVMAANFLRISLPEERPGLIQVVKLGLEAGV